MEKIRFGRVFSMPNRWTFRMRPVHEFIERWMTNGLWVDPFGGQCEVIPPRFCNDLDPNSPAAYNMTADRFAEEFPEHSIDGILFDPPYSPRQISECYKSIGLQVTGKDTQNARLYKSVRDAFLPKLAKGARVLSFGWNSMGWGKGNGFVKKEILLVPHGGAHNDTICVAEIYNGVPNDTQKQLI